MGTVTPHYRSIAQLLQNRTFAIDDYQREYKWEAKNVQELLSDLLAKFESSYVEGDPTTKASGYGDYFLGSIIVSIRGDRSYLIDGQQRTTSLTLLLIYLYRLAKQHEYLAASAIEPLIFSAPFGEPTFNLDIPERVPVIRALFSGEGFSADGKAQSIQNIVARYQDIVEFDLGEQLNDAIEVFIYWLIQKVGLIEIVADDDAQAYAIFETMNDRGKPLSPVDMLKAYLLAQIEEDTQRAAANQVWKKTIVDLASWGEDQDPERDATMIKAWLRSQYSETIRDRKAGSTDKDWELIGTSFHRWLRENTQRAGVGTEKENVRFITEAFPFFADAYRKILDASRSYTSGWEPVFYNAQNDFTWQSTVVLAPLLVTDDADTIRRKINAVATYLDIWIMRRVSNYVRVGYSSASYTMFTLARDIRQKPLPELVATLTDKLNADSKEVSFDGYPARDRGGIAQLGLNQFSGRYIFHMLARLTSYIEVAAGKPDLFDKYVDRTVKNPQDIEHITADVFSKFGGEFASEHDFWFWDWRNGIGGLLLLPADVNRSLQARCYAYKARKYVGQNLFAATLTRQAYMNQPQFTRFIEANGLPFAHYDKFGTAEQHERTELVRLLCHKVWSPDRLASFL